MTTSAQQLSFVLSKINIRQRLKDRFLTVVADLLDIEGADRELVVLSRLHALVKETKADIDKLEYDQHLQKQLYSYINPFSGLENFSHVHLTIEGASKNFLKPENIVNLNNIHFALDGKINRQPAPPNTEEAVTKFRSLKEDLANIDIPLDIRRNIAQRIDHIVLILENAALFGAEDLRYETEALVGAIVLNAPRTGNDTAGFWQKAAKAASLALTALGWSDNAVKKVLSIAGNTMKLLEHLPSNDDE